MPPNKKQSTEDFIEALLDSKVVDALAKALSPFITLTIDEAIGKRLESLSAAVTSLKTENSFLTKSLSEVKEENASLKQKLTQQDTRINDMETYSRCENVIIRGLPEKSASERASAAVVIDDAASVRESYESVENNVLEFFQQSLGVHVHPQDISIAHRLKAGPRETVRPVIVRFVNRKVRDKILSSKSKLKNSNTRVFISEHLTKNSSDLFYAARRSVREKKIFSAWTHNGQVVIKRNENGPKIIVRSEDEIR